LVSLNLTKVANIIWHGLSNVCELKLSTYILFVIEPVSKKKHRIAQCFFIFT